MSGTGMNIAASFSGMDALKNIDMEQILTLVENGTVGKLVELESADGDTVEIVVEWTLRSKKTAAKKSTSAFPMPCSSAQRCWTI